MAGSGYVLFATGDVLTAAQVNNALNEQTIMVFASTSARDTALASVKAAGMFAFNTDSDELYYYSGSAWVQTSLAADITGITTAANSSMAGGATSGAPSLTVDVNNTTSATAVAADYVLIEDVNDSNATKKALISDITALVPQGDLTGLTAGTNIDITSATGPVPTITVAIDAELACANQVVSAAKLQDYSETVEGAGSKSAAFDLDFEDGNVTTATFTSGTFNVGIVNALASHSNSMTLLLTNGGTATPSFLAGANGSGGNAVKWAGGTAPTLTTSGTDVICFTTFDGGTNYYGFAGGLDFSAP